MKATRIEEVCIDSGRFGFMWGYRHRSKWSLAFGHYIYDPQWVGALFAWCDAHNALTTSIRDGLVKATIPSHIADIHRFAALRNRREQQWRRLCPGQTAGSEIRLIHHWRNIPVSEFKRNRLIRRQHQDGVYRHQWLLGNWWSGCERKQ